MDALRIAALVVTLALTPPVAHHPHAGPVAYRGTGAWIDRYDLVQLRDPRAIVNEMAAHGVRTLYVETASWKVPRSVDIVAPARTGELLSAAHAHGMKVVAWYLPDFVHTATDMRRVEAALAFRSADGQAFDSFALDIEATALNPIRRRDVALLELSRRTRRAAGAGYPLGAIVPDQRSTSTGPGLWPRFPYAAVARYYDVFLPMAYSSFNRARGPAAVYGYTASNVRFVRRATHRPVHLIGGLTGQMTPTEQAAAARGAVDAGAIGASLYEYGRYDAASWAALSAFDAG